MPKEQFFGKVASKIEIYFLWTKPKVFMYSSDFITKIGRKSNLQKNH